MECSLNSVSRQSLETVPQSLSSCLGWWGMDIPTESERDKFCGVVALWVLISRLRRLREVWRKHHTVRSHTEFQLQAMYHGSIDLPELYGEQT